MYDFRTVTARRSASADPHPPSLQVPRALLGMREPVIRPRAEHPISRNRIDPEVLKVLYRLHNAGFKAYLVGGSVRDLLLGRTPKDFDVGTDAQPNEVRKLFRNCRIVGRRFRLAHVIFGPGRIVETSTFRKRPEPVEGGTEGSDLLVTDDNTFGTPVEDALRRDFTINGLFYDISTFAVIDYVGGLEDLGNRVVRSIGDPEIRFREDPVRMLRAVEFAARLDFTLTLDAYDAIVRHRREILRSAAPRVTEEILGMLRGPRPLATFRLLSEVGLLDVLLPELVSAIAAHTDRESGEDGTLFWKYLANLEEQASRAKGQRREIPEDAVLLGTLLLPMVFSAVAARVRAGRKLENPELLLLIDEVLAPVALRLTLPNALVHTAKQAIFLLGKLDEPLRSVGLARRIMARSAFPVAFELFRLHATATGRHSEAVARWEGLRSRPAPAGKGAETEPFGEMPPPPAREDDRAGGGGGKRRRRRPRGGRKRPGAAPEAASERPQPEPAEDDLRFRD